VLIWSALEARYGEAHRHYHDKEHLAHCPDQLDLATRAMDHPDRVEMAIWFHDIVNDPGREDNEARNNIQRLLAQMQGRTG
jgi:predicted metal-dependent HD superfamily phosphohydrolase